MRVSCISLHAKFRCRRSGVCCSSGWSIPVEDAPLSRLRTAWATGALTPPLGGNRRGASVGIPRSWPIQGDTGRSLLVPSAAGRCQLLSAGNVCGVHARLGHGALPLACRQFPRLTITELRGVRLSLSHHCPTAAALLLREDVALGVDDTPDAFPEDGEYVGLDATDAWPPLLRPGVLMCWESLDAWERFAVSLFGSPGARPEAVLLALRWAAEEARRWTTADGPFVDFLVGVIGRAAALEATTDDAPPPNLEASLDAWRVAATCVTTGLPQTPRIRDALVAPSPEALAATWEASSRALEESRAVVCRYLAAKAFASWQPLLGSGLRSSVAFLALALSVLRIEAARMAWGSGEPTGSNGDTERLLATIGRADFLLVHLVDSAALARKLSRGEAAC